MTKSRFLSGLQCPRRLWWEAHEPEASELQPDPGLQILLDRGHRVGELARTHVPGGVLIDLPHYALKERATATRRALDDGAPAVYEAVFMADGAFVAVDILEQRRLGFALVEVKSTLDVKPEHIPDVAIQLHVARRAGLDVRRAFLMYLNRECRHPDLSNLFMRDDVTAKAEEAGRGIEEQVRSMLAEIHGPLPDEEPGPRCSEPHECPFWDRCWPPLPEHHVSTLWRIGKRRLAKLLAAGHETCLEPSRPAAR